MMLPARAGHAESALKIRSFFPLHVIFLLINQYLISAQGKGNLVCSLGGLPKKKGFPLHGAKQVRSCLTAEDTFFNHTSNFSMFFSLGSICKQHGLETTFCVPPWATAEKGSGLIISSCRIISLNLPSSKVLTESISSHIPLWRELPQQSTGVPRLPPPPLCPPPAAIWLTTVLQLTHFLQPSTHHGSSGHHHMNKPTTA